MAQPKMYLIVGPNGAGKSTFYENVIRLKIKVPFLNADIVQRDELRNVSMDTSYEAAAIVRERIKKHLTHGKSFVTETVFSHESKLKLITDTQEAGHHVILYHVGVRSADISVKRVDFRVQRGGHPVPEEKIRARFERNQPLICEAAKMADRAFVYDNSVMGRDPQLGIKFKHGQIVEISNRLPKWMQEFYSEELKLYSLTRQNPAAASYELVNDMAKRLSGYECKAAKISHKGDIYHGPIVGESAMHFLQKAHRQGYIAHFKSVLDRQPLKNESVSIEYVTQRHAMVTSLKQIEKNIEEEKGVTNDVSATLLQNPTLQDVDIEELVLETSAHLDDLPPDHAKDWSGCLDIADAKSVIDQDLEKAIAAIPKTDAGKKQVAALQQSKQILDILEKNGVSELDVNPRSGQTPLTRVSAIMSSASSKMLDMKRSQSREDDAGHTL